MLLDLNPYSKKNRFRLARAKLFKRLIDSVLQTKKNCTILDVGGTCDFWRVWGEDIDHSRTEISCVNLQAETNWSPQNRVRVIFGDACDLSFAQDGEYDIAFSNSVIEHVGSWQRMCAMAKEVRRVAPLYFIQTPNFWFPVEPHARFPFLHWMPEQVAYRILMKRQCGFWTKQKSVKEAVGTVQSAKLIDMRQMQALFEDAIILRERFIGLTKSLIAIKGPPCLLS